MENIEKYTFLVLDRPQWFLEFPSDDQWSQKEVKYHFWAPIFIFCQTMITSTKEKNGYYSK